ncbi:MAG: alpha-ketoglutarate-dependent dioxygenase AlkB [Caulobacteraceae bacterium]|nr:alpha-ketoglutarate-dependent dioxygenase AlkB [Caulobacteraceae bacterium]
MSVEIKPGVRLLAGRLDAAAQGELMEKVQAALVEAPLQHHVTPGGKPMSVAMSALGPLGWVSDRSGYRYQPRHPATGRPWPAMPEQLLALWREVTGSATPPDSCLVNLYRGSARMGLHQDRDEADLSFPVVSISLGDTAVFRIGGLSRRDPSTSVRLSSGDVLVLEGPGRLVHHGVDRVLEGSSRLMPGGGRINLTLRRAGPASPDQDPGLSPD